MFNAMQLELNVNQMPWLRLVIFSMLHWSLLFQLSSSLFLLYVCGSIAEVAANKAIMQENLQLAFAPASLILANILCTSNNHAPYHYFNKLLYSRTFVSWA